MNTNEIKIKNNVISDTTFKFAFSTFLYAIIVPTKYNTEIGTAIQAQLFIPYIIVFIERSNLGSIVYKKVL
jgi:hypothetical protein